MDNILKLFDQEEQKCPIWLMRQAGRYMPEYMKIKANFPDFFSMCKNVGAVCDITMQPIKRFNLDAAIIFSDILIILQCIGIKVKFVTGVGPIVQDYDDRIFENIEEKDFDLSHLRPVYESIAILKKKLSKLNKPLIGFAAAPWTLATYLIERQLSKEHIKIRELAYKSPKKLDKIVKVLSKLIKIHLKNQIKFGVDIVQIFDTHASYMDNFLFDKYFFKELEDISTDIKNDYPDIYVSLFTKSNYILNSKIYNNIDCISFNSHVRMKDYINNIPNDVCFQGNLDPMRLVVGGQSLIEATESILKDMQHKNFIFNLGHGILPQTPIDNVHLLINTVKSFKQTV